MIKLKTLKTRLKQLKASKEKVLKLNPDASTPTLDALIDRNEQELHVLQHGHCCNGKHTLAMSKRKQTVNEEKVNWVKLQQTFDSEENKLEKELLDILEKEAEKVLSDLEKILAAGTILALTGLGFSILTKTKRAIKESMQSSYDKGRKSASAEVKVDRPKQSQLSKDIIRLDSELTAELIESGLTEETRNYVKGAILAGVAASAIVIATRDKLRTEIEKYVRNTKGIVPGTYINAGREDVFVSNAAQKKIVGYQRSEILDDRICPLCQSLDGRFILPDDPMYKMKLVHTNCRGVWVSVYDKTQIKNPGIPKSIMDRFDLVGGVPITNSFKQLKKPIE